MEFLEILKNSPLFSGISERKAEEILETMNAKTVMYKKSEFILHSGEHTENIGILLSGSALVIQEDFWGNRNIMTKLTPGALFAESFACSPGSLLNVSVAAETDSSVMFISAERIFMLSPAACPQSSRIIRNLLSDIAGKNLRFNEKITHMSKRTTREKLLSFLSAEAQRCGRTEFDIPFSRQQLADYLSVDRSAMSAELSRLHRDGIVSYRKNHFVLCREHTL